MTDMTPVHCWWQGLPGIDGNCLSGDLTFDDRAAAIAIASRLHGALPLEGDHTGPARAAHKTAEELFKMFQDTETEQEALRSRLALAFVVSTMTPGEPYELHKVKTRSQALLRLMSLAGRKTPKRATRASRLTAAG
jgi:hypothetical protein